MPYIETEKVKEIRDALKKEFPGVKFSVVREHLSSIRCSIMESPYEEFDGLRSGLNHYPMYLKQHHAGKLYLNFLVKIAEILNKDVKTVSHDGDYGSIPNYYVTMQIGKWDKPHITNKNIKNTWDKM